MKKGEAFQWNDRWYKAIAVNQSWMGQRPPPANIAHPRGVLHTIRGKMVYMVRIRPPTAANFRQPTSRSRAPHP